MSTVPDWLAEAEGFQWDAGNRLKNWEKHRVAAGEAEEVFFNAPLFVFDDDTHSNVERRRICLGQTGAGRKLSLVFTVREGKIRIISARDMSRKERTEYEKGA